MKKKIIAALLVVLGVPMIGLAIEAGYVYWNGYNFYQNHFYDGTKVVFSTPDGSTTYGEVDLSGMTVEEAEDYVFGLTDDYVLTIDEPDGSKEEITAADISLTVSEDGKTAIEQTLADQDYKEWYNHITDLRNAVETQRVTVDQTISVSASYDADALAKKIDSLKCINPDEVVEPENAVLAYDETTLRYVVKEGAVGNQGIKENIEPKIEAAVNTLESSVELDSSDYAQPEIGTDDETLCAKRDEINKYLNASITLKDGDKSYVVDADDIINFLDIDDDWNVTLSESKVRRFISYNLDPVFDTVGMTRTITTPSSGTFTVSGGTFGRMVKTHDELPTLMEEITNGETIERLPCYYDTSYEQTSENGGIGNTYIDVNITKQQVSVVKDGEITIQTDCVTGLANGERNTPTGTYYITRKVTNYTMVKYDSFVNYWMPIDDSVGVGLHDATWRSKFGGTIYKTSGSHGCINLPLSAAKEIYENVTAGMIVVVHD